MVKDTTKELIRNEILLSLDSDRNGREKDLEKHHSSLLSALNVFQDFLLEYDRFLTHSAGYDCELTLYMDNLDESGFRFTLRYGLILSDQLFLGERDISSQLQGWLIEMHLNLLADINSILEEKCLDNLIERAYRRAEILELNREPYFSLLPTPWHLSRLERRYARMIETLESLDGFLSLKIQKI